MPAGRRARSIGATAYTSTSPAMSTKGRRSAAERREAPRRAPAMHTAGKTRLRVLGTGVTLVPSIQAEAAKDLGVALVFDVRDGLAAQQQAVMHPQDFDVYDQWFNSLDLGWFSRSVQPIEAARIKRVKQHLTPEEWDFWVRGQRRGDRHARPQRRGHRAQGRSAQRRLLLAPRRQYCRVELGHGRAQLSRPALERIPVGIGQGEARSMPARQNARPDAVATARAVKGAVGPDLG
jgi:hypothetical protein